MKTKVVRSFNSKKNILSSVYITTELSLDKFEIADIVKKLIDFGYNLFSISLNGKSENQFIYLDYDFELNNILKMSISIFIRNKSFYIYYNKFITSKFSIRKGSV